MNSYKILEEKIKACRKCHLRDTCLQVVPGEGNFEADIMFIGEGPGENEDKQGRPFVGAAGKFLEEMLSLIGKNREDVFIGNVLKCRPPGNRDPLPEEVKACWPWMMEQIKIIKPKLVVLLGRHAMERFLPGKPCAVKFWRLESRFSMCSTTRPLRSIRAACVKLSKRISKKSRK